MHCFAASEAEQGAFRVLYRIETSMNLRMFAALL